MKTAQPNLLTKGFTLIELLVVIGILGILATALIATIDPFEQLKKAQDSNVKNSAVEYVNATLRYFTTHNALPWGPVGSGGFTGCGLNPASGVLAFTNLSAAAACINGLTADGELKPGFGSATNITKEVFILGTSNTATACFVPQSKAQQNDPNTKYSTTDATPVADASCKSQGGSGNCAYCAIL